MKSSIGKNTLENFAFNFWTCSVFTIFRSPSPIRKVKVIHAKRKSHQTARDDLILNAASISYICLQIWNSVSQNDKFFLNPTRPLILDPQPMLHFPSQDKSLHVPNALLFAIKNLWQSEKNTTRAGTMKRAVISAANSIIYRDRGTSLCPHIFISRLAQTFLGRPSGQILKRTCPVLKSSYKTRSEIFAQRDLGLRTRGL